MQYWILYDCPHRSGRHDTKLQFSKSNSIQSHAGMRALGPTCHVTLPFFHRVPNLVPESPRKWGHDIPQSTAGWWQSQSKIGISSIEIDLTALLTQKSSASGHTIFSRAVPSKRAFCDDWDLLWSAWRYLVWDNMAATDHRWPWSTWNSKTEELSFKFYLYLNTLNLKNHSG